MPQINLLLYFSAVLLVLIFIQLIQRKYYWYILLIISIFVYYIIASYSVLIIFLIALATYFFSFQVKKRIAWWMIGIIILPLLIYKLFVSQYQLNNLNNHTLNTNSIFNLVGISYITFNAIGYLFDIKRNYISPQKQFLKLLLYLFYFPIIISGPLTRAKYFFQQIKNITINEKSFSNGLRLILWGLFKNLIISNRLFLLLSQLIDMNLTGVYYLIVGFVFYLFLYCSFSSFINIFRGFSLLFNIHIKANFNNRVYLSASREEFWRGWHITLNQWFRDYFFYEIIKYDKKRKHTNLLLFITFICIAVWHDFTFVFFLWGIFNAIWLIAERKYKSRLRKKINIHRYLGVLYHTIFSSFLATIFIAEDLKTLYDSYFTLSHSNFSISFLSKKNIIIVGVAFLIMDYFEKKAKKISLSEYIGKQNRWYRYTFYYSICLMLLFFAKNLNIVNLYNLF